MRHLPTMLRLPQLAIANNKAAEAIILKLEFDSAKRIRMEL
jgi:hypothetical protein